MAIVEIKTLSKNYGEIQALDNISFDICEGKIFALLGPNGAGKTTLLRAVLNLTMNYRGSITLNGLNSRNEKARVGVAFCPEKFHFFPYYNVAGTLHFFGKMKGLRGRELDSKLEQALKELGISDLSQRKMGGLSKGQLQRVGLASLLMGEHRLLFLDEPFSGIDPVGIRDLKILLKKLKAQGKTIVLSSHILAEIESLCDDVVILDKGKLMASGQLQKLIGSGSLEDYFCRLVASEA